MHLLRCFASLTGCSTRTGGIQPHLPTTTEPGTWLSMTGCTIMPIGTFSGFLAGDSKLQPCCLCLLCPLWFMNTHWGSALDFSILFFSFYLWALAWFLTSSFMIVGKVPSGMWSCGRLCSWVRVFSYVFIPRSGMPRNTAPSAILHFWTSWSHGLGPAMLTSKLEKLQKLHCQRLWQKKKNRLTSSICYWMFLYQFWKPSVVRDYSFCKGFNFPFSIDKYQHWASCLEWCHSSDVCNTIHSFSLRYTKFGLQ